MRSCRVMVSIGSPVIDGFRRHAPDGTRHTSRGLEEGGIDARWQRLPERCRANWRVADGTHGSLTPWLLAADASAMQEGGSRGPPAASCIN